jgi:RNA methyltransferase, TrmH family
MLSKKEIKDIQSLGLKKQREERGLFVAEGPKIVWELASEFPQQVQQMYALSSWQPPISLPSGQLTIITETELSRISQLQTPNEVLAVFHQFPHQPPQDFRFALYLDTIQDPGNLGTIIRIADWFAVEAIVCSRHCADMYNPKVVQSSMASIGRMPVYYDEQENWLQKQNKPVFAATLHGRSLRTIDKIEEGILIIGNESKGIRPELIELADQQITIDRIGKAESLNAAVASGILLSHLLGR